MIERLKSMIDLRITPVVINLSQVLYNTEQFEDIKISSHMCILIRPALYMNPEY